MGSDVSGSHWDYSAVEWDCIVEREGGGWPKGEVMDGKHRGKHVYIFAGSNT